MTQEGLKKAQRAHTLARVAALNASRRQMLEQREEKKDG